MTLPPRPSFGERLQRVVLHPAFAYAIALLLLYPALQGRLPWPRREAAREERSVFADRQAAKSAPAPVDALRSGLEAEPAAPASADTLARAGREKAARALGGLAERDVEPAPAAEGRADEKAERTFMKHSAAPGAAGWTTLPLLRPGAPLEVAARELGVGLVLTLPVPEAARSGTVQVRVLDAQGGREMSERFAGAPERVAMRLPALWLTPGTYTAELRRLDSEPAAAEVFAFRVVP